ncbi:MAG TPA: penicillin acylase family protein [Chitinophagales bacterium]|nr:penicillin acylase family protein [Chitinophagales bacterium]
MRYHKITCRLALLIFFFRFQPLSAQQEFPKINPQDVTIVRDSFGIPHIFAKTDAEVAYGLAYANAEDAFSETQTLVYIGKEVMGHVDGIDGVKADFFIHAIGARQLVEEHYDKDLSPEFKKYFDGYVQGLNAYAASHPDEVQYKPGFPATAKDLMVAYVVTMSYLSDAQDAVGDIIDGKYDTCIVNFPVHKRMTVGSNAFALSSVKTTNGETILCTNPHMGMDGGLSFYEAHLHSDEGLNIEGALFQGISSVNMGANENLAWGMTWNFFDRLDEFKLKMVQGKKLTYEFDGQEYKLEKRPVWLKVGLGKHHHFVLPVKKTTYWSKYGCTLKSGKSNNYYSIRFPGNMSILAGEQLYRMNKARNMDEFRAALRTHAIVLFNVVYADKSDNIFYLEHGTLPDRDTSFNWKGVVPGNTSKTLWTKLIPLDSMPHNINPSCGYVYNTNNTPFHSSGVDCSDARCPYPTCVVDGLPGDNNRATRFEELISAKSKFNLDDLRKIKFDVTLSHHGGFGRSVEPLFHLDENKYPDLKDALEILKNWDRKSEIHEYAPTILGLVIRDIFTRRGYDDNPFCTGFYVSEDEWVSSLRKACDTLKSYFGTVKVEWGTVHHNIRGDKSLPMRGFADMLSPSYPDRVPGKTLMFKPNFGDTYTMFAVFDKTGLKRLEAVQPCGNSLNPKSPHFNDQMELFANQQLRHLSLNKDDVMKMAASVYHPK